MVNQEDLVKRYLKTNKGRHIISTSVELPIRICRTVYKNDQLYYKIDEKLYNTEEAEAWKQKVREEHRNRCMELYSLTEDDFNLSEEKLKQI